MWCVALLCLGGFADVVVGGLRAFGCYLVWCLLLLFVDVVFVLRCYC